MNLQTLGLFAVITLAVCAADTNDFPTVTVPGGQTLTNAYISHFDSSNAWIWQRSGGGGKYALANLPPEVQARCHYDAASVARKAEAVQNKKTAASKAEKEWEHAHNFLLLDGFEIEKKELEILVGHVSQVLPDQHAILFYLTGRVRNATETLLEPASKMVFIRDINLKNATEGDEIQIIAASVGTYTYETVLGARSTVEKFTCAHPLPPSKPAQIMEKTNSIAK